MTTRGGGVRQCRNHCLLGFRPSSLAMTITAGRRCSTSVSWSCIPKISESPPEWSTSLRTSRCHAGPPPQSGEPIDRPLLVVEQNDLAKRSSTGVTYCFEPLDSLNRLRYCGSTTSWPDHRCTSAIPRAASVRASAPVSEKRSRQPPMRRRTWSMSRLSTSGCDPHTAGRSWTSRYLAVR